jgi:ABC-type branched-subunit amino acid transport system substrate-binding protein
LELFDVATIDIPIGLLISVDGPYSAVSAGMLAGALLAIDEVNGSGLPVRLDPVVGNPQGQLARYVSISGSMLASGIRHVVGCYTSSSRKEVIPLFEKADALLWYPSHYEGFESSPNVVYTGPVANQHLLPLIDYLLQHVGRRAFCIGSNYIWAWENNRVMREAMAAAGGCVIAERYFAMDDTDFGQIIQAILNERPSFIFNTLIGISSYQFLRDLRAACAQEGIDQPAVLPIASCTLSEPELEAVGREAADGHIVSSVYFSSIKSPENARFAAAYKARRPGGPAVSADAEATYLAVKLLGLALAEAGTSEIGAVKQAVARQVLTAPQGQVQISPETMHATLTPRIGRSTSAGEFEIVVEASQPIPADPYLLQNSSRFGAVSERSKLRVVS